MAGAQVTGPFRKDEQLPIGSEVSLAVIQGLVIFCRSDRFGSGTVLFANDFDARKK